MIGQAARSEATGLLATPGYHCATCIMCETHHDRNCTGAPVRHRGPITVLDGVPRLVPTATAPAYPDGWYSISAETGAALGFSLVDALTHDEEAGDPIMHCIRLAWASPFVHRWLRTYSLIRDGLQRPPEFVSDAYAAIMLSIRAATEGVSYARIKGAVDG